MTDCLSVWHVACMHQGRSHRLQLSTVTELIALSWGKEGIIVCQGMLLIIVICSNCPTKALLWPVKFQ